MTTAPQSEPPPRRPVGLAVVSALIAIGCAAAGIYFLYLGLASLTWPTVEGRMDMVGVTESKSADSKGRSRRSYRFGCWYFYRIPGSETQYAGTDAICGSQMFSSREDAERLAARFTEGAPVPVHYNPRNPRKSVLIPGVDVPSVAAGLVPAAICAWFTRALLRRPAASKGS